MDSKKGYFFQSILDISQQSKVDSNVFAVVLIIIKFLLITLLASDPLLLEDWMSRSLLVEILLLGMVLVYVILCILAIIFKFIISSTDPLHITESNIKANSVVTKLLGWMLLPIETVVFPFMLLLLIIIVFGDGMSNIFSFFNSTGIIITKIAYCVLFAIVFGLTFFKLLIVRPIMPGNCSFAKVYSVYEPISQIFILSIGIIEGIQILTDVPFTIVLQVLKNMVFALKQYTYFKELPYFEMIVERMYGRGLVLTWMFCLVNDVTGSLQDASQIILILGPFVLVIIGYVFDFLYNQNDLDPKQINFNTLKKVLLIPHSSFDVSKIIHDYGVFFKHTADCKKISCKCKMLYKQLFKIKMTVAQEKAQSMESPDENEIIRLKREVLKKSTDKIFSKIDEFCLNEYLNLGHDPFFKHYFRLVWMLKRGFIISEGLQCFKEMKSRNNSFIKKYIIFYLELELETKLKGYYFFKDLYLQRKEIVYENNEQELADINRKGIDISYAFFYKNSIKKIQGLIDVCIEKNRNFMNLLRTKNSHIKKLTSICSKVQTTTELIDLNFSYFNKRTKEVDYLHLPIYYYFLLIIKNLYRSSFLVFKDYKHRLTVQSKISMDQTLELSENNMLSNCVLFLTESNKRNFGTILDVYGDYTYLETQCKDLIGKGFEIAIPQSLVAPHLESALKLVRNPIVPLLGENVRKTFMRIPDQDYMVPAGLSIKMVPFKIFEFRFVTGIKIDCLNTKMHILIDSNGDIDCYSSNMRDMFQDPEAYLYKGVKLEDLSSELKEFIDSKLGKDKRKKKSVVGNQPPKNRRKRILSTFIDMSGLGKDFDLDEQDESKIKTLLKFRNRNDGTLLGTSFQLYFNKREFFMIDYSYIILTLEPIDLDQISTPFQGSKSKGLKMDSIPSMILEEGSQISRVGSQVSSNQIVSKSGKQFSGLNSLGVGHSDSMTKKIVKKSMGKTKTAGKLTKYSEADQDKLTKNLLGGKTKNSARIISEALLNKITEEEGKIGLMEVKDVSTAKNVVNKKNTIKRNQTINKSQNVIL